jgi:hypothetical protein
MPRIVNQRLKDWLRSCPLKEAEAWFEIIAPSNPLKGSDNGYNTNSIMVQVGRRLAVDEILAYAKGEKEGKEPEPFTPVASDLLNKYTK